MVDNFTALFKADYQYLPLSECVCVCVYSGPEFESRIKLNEAGNAKFNFLNAHDPYNAYYRHKIKEIQEGVAQEKAAAAQPGYVVSAPKMVENIVQQLALCSRLKFVSAQVGLNLCQCNFQVNIGCPLYTVYRANYSSQTSDIFQII